MEGVATILLIEASLSADTDLCMANCKMLFSLPFTFSFDKFSPQFWQLSHEQRSEHATPA